MHPGIFYKWKRACAEASNHRRAHAGGGESGYHAAHGGMGSWFGVRRPLRFMAHKLDLDDEQVKQMAAILNDIKTERAQAAVDDQRTISAFADALSGETFDSSRAEEGLELRVGSAQRLRDAVLKALERTHALLTPEQRDKLAYMLRSGTLTI